MKKRVVTCPETDREEEIGYLADRHEHVLVVLRCTRFDPPQAIACTSGCADAINDRLCDQRERRAPRGRR